MRKLKISFCYALFAICFLAPVSYAKELKMQEYVAHGGGAINNISSTNSLEALEYNYQKGFRFFEVDFEWTSDGDLVLIHDWKESLKRLYDKEPNIYSLKDFKGLKMKSGFTQMALPGLIKWLKNHLDAYIITDIKSNNLKGLENISQKYAKLKGHFIPQVYKYEEYDKVKDMGFKDIILTLYAMNYGDDEVINFLNNHKVSALTIWYYRTNKDFIDRLQKIGVFVYVHTVNELELKNKLKDIGVGGFYTDFINPAEK